MALYESSGRAAELDREATREMDQRVCDAFSRKDLEAAMACFWDSPDLVVILFGTVYRGTEAVREAVTKMFEENESINLVVDDVSHIRTGDDVLAVGTASYTLKPHDGPPRLIVERWSDLRRKIDGRWVMVIDHTTIVPE